MNCITHVLRPSSPATSPGLLTALALFVHNFPEGLATFVGALADTKVGVGLGECLSLLAVSPQPTSAASRSPC
jgi:zinc transporter ZupT